jgi:uncharacterized protein YuzE
MYIRLIKGKVDRSEPLANNIIVDVDKKGEAIGIEILLLKHDIRVSEDISKSLKVKQIVDTILLYPASIDYCDYAAGDTC